MPAARYWRAVGLRAYGGDDVELSALHLYESGGGDPAFANVSVLLHFDGANGSAVFTDSSATPNSVAAYGGATISTAQSKFGGAALAAGIGGVSIPHSDAINPIGADFTVEMWVRASALSGNGIVFNKANDTAGDFPYQVYVTTSGAVVFHSYGSSSPRFTITTPGGVVTLNTWVHLAFVRSGSTFSVYADGTPVGSATYSGALSSNAFPLSIGSYSMGGYPFKGHIDDFRFTLGLARYTAAFVPPAAPFPDAAAGSTFVRVDQTAVLTCTVPAVSGSISGLQDTDFDSVTRLRARSSGHALVWDFGAGVEKEPVLAAIGSGSRADLFLSQFDLQSSSDGVLWGQRGIMGRYAWPGPYTLLPPSNGGESPAVSAGAPHSVGLAASAAVPAHAAVALRGFGVARDVEFGGFGAVSGTVERDADPVDLPMRRRVRLFDERSGLLVRETWSDAATGAYSFAGLDAARTYTVIAYDHEHHYRAVIADNMTPEAAP